MVCPSTSVYDCECFAAVVILLVFCIFLFQSLCGECFELWPMPSLRLNLYIKPTYCIYYSHTAPFLHTRA